MENIGILDAGIVALLGYAVVFFGLILLMAVVMVIGKIFIAKDAKAKAADPAVQAASAPAAVPAQEEPAAPRRSAARSKSIDIDISVDE